MIPHQPTKFYCRYAVGTGQEIEKLAFDETHAREADTVLLNNGIPRREALVLVNKWNAQQARSASGIIKFLYWVE